MRDRAYRAPVKYWALSTLVVVALMFIPVIVLGGIPGVPHFGKAAGEWRGFYAGRHYGALALALCWAATAVGFSYLAIRALRDLISPQSLRGILEQVEWTEARAKRVGWVKVSGVRRAVRYEKSVFDLLERQKITGAVVDVRIGVGGRVASVDLI
jgi:hypothetical protein